jgi:histone H3/H4
MATRKADVGLTPKQEQALIALLNEPTIERAAKTAGVGERTLHRWLDEPVFSRAYRKARREAFAQAMSASQKYAPVAVQVLAKIMTDATLSVSARVSAATALLKFSRESIELDDLATRVDDLERSMKEASERSPEPPQANWGDRACA